MIRLADIFLSQQLHQSGKTDTGSITLAANTFLNLDTGLVSSEPQVQGEKCAAAVH